MTLTPEKLITEELPYPSGDFMKYAYKLPIVLYRLGFGTLVGQLFMILTTTGRKTGLPRRTAIEFHEHKDIKYVMVGWSASDWYKNILSNPLVTIQTAAGVEHGRARRITSDEDLSAAWDVAENSPLLRGMIALANVGLTRETFIAQKDRFIILTFDPTDEATPAPLDVDLRWLTTAAANVLMGLLIQHWLRARWRKLVRRGGSKR